MNRVSRIMAISSLLGALAAGAGPLSAQEAPGRADVVGSWIGTLNAGGQQLRLVFHIERDASGTLTGALDSPDQGAYGMALGYALSTRGGCHLRAYPISHEIFRKPVATDRFSFSGKARIIKIKKPSTLI